jgi:hypothetical protein
MLLVVVLFSACGAITSAVELRFCTVGAAVVLTLCCRIVHYYRHTN